jgi:hypothetical protein
VIGETKGKPPVDPQRFKEAISIKKTPVANGDDSFRLRKYAAI